MTWLRHSSPWLSYAAREVVAHRTNDLVWGLICFSSAIVAVNSVDGCRVGSVAAERTAYQRGVAVAGAGLSCGKVASINICTLGTTPGCPKGSLDPMLVNLSSLAPRATNYIPVE